jgi:GNAT superfamily N-acetyltransferase
MSRAVSLVVANNRYDPISRHFILSLNQPSPPDTSFSSILPISSVKAETSTASRPIGTIRWTPSIGKVARVTIMQEYRQYGFGRVLMEELERYIAEKEDMEKLKDIYREDGDRKYARIKLNSQVRSLNTTDQSSDTE